MPDDRFSFRNDEDPDHWTLIDATDDDRLRHLVYVDGRLVECSVAAVAGTRWEHHARRFDDERRVVPSAPARRPPHELVLDWLDGLVGGRAALLALSAEPAATPPPPTLGDADSAAAFEAVAAHLDRVAGAFFDEEVLAVLDWALHVLWERKPRHFTTTQSANVTAAGLVWVVGKANALFTGGLSQQTVQRELWLRQSLSAAGQRVAPALRGISLTLGQPPAAAPDLMAFAEPGLLTPTTRRIVCDWRDRALEAAALADEAGPT